MRRYILFLYSRLRNNISFIVKYIIASGFCIVDHNKFLPYHFGILSNKNRVKFYSQKKENTYYFRTYERYKAYTVCMYIATVCLFSADIYTHTHIHLHICVCAQKHTPRSYSFFVFRFFFVFVISLRHQSGPLMPGPTYINVCVCVCIPSLSTHTLIDAAPTVVVVVAVAACCQRQNATSKIK